jgi:hypothetical protein
MEQPDKTSTQAPDKAAIDAAPPGSMTIPVLTGTARLLD